MYLRYAKWKTWVDFRFNRYFFFVLTYIIDLFKLDWCRLLLVVEKKLTLQLMLGSFEPRKKLNSFFHAWNECLKSYNSRVINEIYARHNHNKEEVGKKIISYDQTYQTREVTKCDKNKCNANIYFFASEHKCALI